MQVYLEAFRERQCVTDDRVSIFGHCGGLYKRALLQSLNSGGRHRHLDQLELPEAQGCLLFDVYHLRREKFKAKVLEG